LIVGKDARLMAAIAGGELIAQFAEGPIYRAPLGIEWRDCLCLHWLYPQRNRWQITTLISPANSANCQGLPINKKPVNTQNSSAA
jgi:hypothetical protein